MWFFEDKNLSIDGRFLKGSDPGKLKRIFHENSKQFVFIFIAFLLMVLVSYLFTSNIVEKQIMANAEELLSAADNMVYANLRDIEVCILTASFSLQSRLDYGQSYEQIADYMAELTEWLLRSPNRVEGFTGFYGYLRGQYCSGSPVTLREDYAAQEESWYIEARQQNGLIAVSSPYFHKQTGTVIITVSKTVMGQSGEIYGVVAMDMVIDKTLDYVKKLQFIEGGYGLLIDQDFTFIAHPDPYYLGRKMDELGEDYKMLVQSMKAGYASIPAVRLVNHAGVQVVVFFRQLISSGWFLGIATPLNSYYHDVFLMALVLSLLGFVLMIILCYFLIRLSAAKIRSDEENKSKSSFLARMSHEIRTPMNSIMGMVELIGRKDISVEIMEYISIIRQSGVTLLAIINDILDFSKIESGLLQIESRQYSPASMINDIVNVFRIRFAEKPVDFMVDVDSNIPAQLCGDPVRIRQIVTNLLNNAEKYTPSGYVSLEVLMEGLEGNCIKLIIKVSDSGIGIKAEDLDKLFHDFTRVDMDRNQGIEGTGLGLTIARSFCKAMGGDITVTSEYGRGSVFKATMVQQFVSGKKLAQVENPERKRVLLYEERFAYGCSLISAFKTLGIDPVCSPTLADFLNDLTEGDFNFAFIASKYAADCIRVLGKRTVPVKLILMVELGEATVFKNTGSILMPVYSISLANVLNGITTGEGDQVRDGGIRFTAPTARVLVVDDIATNLRVAAELMAPYKMVIDTSLSGAEAIEMVREYRYDLVFMDHMMPHMDGIRATAIIREMGKRDPYYRTLPIIALTANAIFGQREMFLQNGIDDFLAKPIEMSKLNAILEQWIPREKQIKIVDPERQEMAGMMQLPNIAGVDVKTGLQNTGGSPEAYLRILSVFYRDTQERIAQIKTAEETGDLSLYTTLVHALKGACRSIGALSCGDFAARLEDAGNNRDKAAIHQNTGAFLIELETLMGHILSVLEQDVAEKDPPGTVSLTSLQLEFLREALFNMDIELVNKLINEYTNTPLDKKTRVFIADIEQYILLFEYDKAIEKLDLFL
jgi:signal transduction histidine kinase/CheY-like chemotaxis protein/HPt (histidine-containing phosphotransfer) domain-containing protein